ncbi:hypothetical protein [Staphylococcus pettenkoferi]|uniref:hypothetical protein n=1 Tax=Staphylococcus pettenkoferi TaxID=170573 RepID=UPI0022740F22|nr:hypothetical protein [Staphylococcus pettenkoferi]MCY1604509.1 hypothetical protein [Staphylococcus pettenkoferi]
MSEIRMVTYEPMIFKKRGIKVVDNNKDIPEFLDASIRTEPSLNVEYPGVSSLCRGSKLAPKLKEGDKMVYLTKKNMYGQDFKHWRLVAIIEVIKVMKTHEDAAKWYKNYNYELPKNCVVDGNPPLSASKTTIAKSKIHETERGYKFRARKYKQFNICKKVHVNLKEPPIIDESKMKEIFGTKNPGTQSFKKVSDDEYKSLVKLMEL